MSALREAAIRAVIIVLGLGGILYAQDGVTGGGPQFCPPIDQLTTPTLLDVLIRPGFSTG